MLISISVRPIGQFSIGRASNRSIDRFVVEETREAFCAVGGDGASFEWSVLASVGRERDSETDGRVTRKAPAMSSGSGSLSHPSNFLSKKSES